MFYLRSTFRTIINGYRYWKMKKQTTEGKGIKEFIVEENIIMWAFRYSLGRRTGAVDSVIKCLFNNWSKLSDHTRNQIKDEIKTAIERDEAGANCDVNNWKTVLEFNHPTTKYD